MTAIELAERDLRKAVLNLGRAERRPNIPAADLEHHRELVELRKEVLGLLGVQPEPPKQPETCRERLQREYQGKVDPDCYGGCYGCPHGYGYAEIPYYCDNSRTAEVCQLCWDRPLEED